MDIGESLVGAYLRHVGHCDVVVYNSFFADRQGEVDVVGLRQTNPREVWLCEVTTHIGGMLLTRERKNATELVLRQKLERLRDFAATTFPGERHRYEWWSLRVPVGQVTAAMKSIEKEWAADGQELGFVINEAYTDRIRQLARHASRHSNTTNEPAYRLLQILTHLHGGGIVELD